MAARGRPEKGRGCAEVGRGKKSWEEEGKL